MVSSPRSASICNTKAVDDNAKARIQLGDVDGIGADAGHFKGPLARLGGAQDCDVRALGDGGGGIGVTFGNA